MKWMITIGWKVVLVKDSETENILIYISNVKLKRNKNSYGKFKALCMVGWSWVWSMNCFKEWRLLMAFIFMRLLSTSWFICSFTTQSYKFTDNKSQITHKSLYGIWSMSWLWGKITDCTTTIYLFMILFWWLSFNKN